MANIIRERQTRSQNTIGVIKMQLALLDIRASFFEGRRGMNRRIGRLCRVRDVERRRLIIGGVYELLQFSVCSRQCTVRMRRAKRG